MLLINGRISYDENLEYFFDQIHEEINKGNVYFMHPDQLFVNILALITYPYIAEPLIKKLLQKEGREYDRFITQRKKELYHFIINAITPMSQK